MPSAPLYGRAVSPLKSDDGHVQTPSTGTLTFLFTDLEGSTRLWEQFPDAMQVALRRHDAILREAIEGAGGSVVKTTGDGMMAVFAGAIDAVTASLAAQRGLIAEPWGETGPLRVRMGIHCGQAEQRGGDYFGTTVNRAARIMAAGHGGQVLLSASAGRARDRAAPGRRRRSSTSASTTCGTSGAPSTCTSSSTRTCRRSSRAGHRPERGHRPAVEGRRADRQNRRDRADHAIAWPTGPSAS